MDDLFNWFSEEQKKAVFVDKGPVRVIAAAGSGKTSVLAARYVWLRRKLSVPANRIACVTFTNKAAKEMRSRICKMLGRFESLEFVCTFHSLGHRIIKTNANKMGWPKEGIAILDDSDIEHILTRIYDEAGITARQITHADAIDYIKGRKVRDFAYASLLLPSPNNILDKMINEAAVPAEKIYLTYLRKQRNDFALDFDDLIQIPLFLFARFPEVHEQWAGKFHYMMVDEFQDVSDTNYALCSALNCRNLYVVGDPDQLIYSWRKAEMSYILQFENAHPGAQTFTMNTNYRSAPAIIQAANQLIAHNEVRFEKEMNPCEAKLQDTARVKFVHTRIRQEEAEFVANEIKRLKESGRKYSDVKVLYRTHETARSFEETLIKNKIPYITRGQTPFYRTQEIKAILSYLRLINFDNNRDFEAAISFPKRSIGGKTFEKIRSRIDETHPTMLSALRAMLDEGTIRSEKAKTFVQLIDTVTQQKDAMSLQNLVEMVIEESGLQEHYQTIGKSERLENIAELKNSIRRMEDRNPERVTLEDYLDEIAAFTVADNDTDADAVELMTVHAAKGTEAPVIFVVAMNDTIFPSSKASTPKAFEEERRLAYVAFTRAKDLLYITECEYFTDHEDNPSAPPMLPSPFILEAGYEDMDHVNGDIPDHIQELMKAKSDGINAIEAEQTYCEGDSVFHDTFGEGVVEEVLDDGTLLVNFYSYGETRTIAIDENLHPF